MLKLSLLAWRIEGLIREWSFSFSEYSLDKRSELTVQYIDKLTGRAYLP